MTPLRSTVDSLHLSQVFQTGHMISPLPHDRVLTHELGMANAWLALARIFPERHYEPDVPDMSNF